MSMHIDAKPGEIADRIVLVGDPFRANISLKPVLKMLFLSMKNVPHTVIQALTTA